MVDVYAILMSGVVCIAGKLSIWLSEYDDNSVGINGNDESNHRYVDP